MQSEQKIPNIAFLASLLRRLELWRKWLRRNCSLITGQAAILTTLRILPYMRAIDSTLDQPKTLRYSIRFLTALCNLKYSSGTNTLIQHDDR